LQRRNRTLAQLNQVGQELVTTLDQFQITEQLLQVVTEIVGAQESSVWLWEKDEPSSLHQEGAAHSEDAAHSENTGQKWLVCRAASPHAQGGSPLNLRVRPNQGVVGWVAQNEESAIVSSASDDARFFPGIDEQSGFHTRSLLAVPLRVRGRVIGALEAVNKLDGDGVPGQGEFDETDITLLETLAASAAIAIDNADLVEALRRRTTELQERNEDLDAYAHTVAHDLKGPLAHMIGFAQVLEQSFAELPAEALRRHLRTISQSGRKMNNIIDELLLLARLREKEVTSISLDMGGIVEESLARLAYMVEAHQAQVVLPESWPLALGYGPWVEEIWVNYLSNALMYGGRPPRVELGFDVLESREWGVGSGQSTPTDDPLAPAASTELCRSRSAGDQQPTTTIRFWVRDNGPGLTQDEQARLFRSFERLDQVRAKGHGLGLSIVRRIAEKLEGEVGVESAPGQGSVFWFTLPGV
jgi:signal transduction histidine kinase